MDDDQTLERYREVFERIPVGIYRTTPDGQFLHANPELVTLLGYDSYAELAAVNTQDLYFDPQDRTAWRETMEREGVITDHDTRKLRRDGKVLWLRDNARCVRDEAGEVRYYEGAVIDVTEAHRMAQQLARSERLASVGVLAAGVAHEVNNPLAYVLTNVEYALSEVRNVLRAGIADREAEMLIEVARALGEAVDGVERMGGIVTQLSSFARDDEEAAPRSDIGDVVESALRMVQNELRHCATLHVDIEPLPAVVGNSTKLVQVFVNLLVNAAQAFEQSPQGPNEVRIVGRRADGDRVLVTVSDTAGGIAPEDLERLFDPFFTTKPRGAGTGLGLTISQSTIIAAGGSMAVESEVGQGTTFLITLPVSRQREEPASSRRQSSLIPAASTQLVLIVDDEALIGRSLKRALRPDYEVTIVTSAQEAIEQLAAGLRFDAILCDVMMPEMNGVEFYRWLLDAHPAQAERLAFITGGIFGGLMADQLPTHWNVPMLTKPISNRQVRALLRQITA